MKRAAFCHSSDQNAQKRKHNRPPKNPDHGLAPGDMLDETRIEREQAELETPEAMSMSEHLHISRFHHASPTIRRM